MAGIYVHIPFCRTKCGYCDFYSVAAPSLRRTVAEALMREYDMRMDELAGEQVRTLYFGGGTPSQLPDDTLAALARKMLTDDVAEFTIEVNPEDVTLDRVKAWVNMGVNRVSMGVQSFVDSELKTMRRRHDSRRALDAVDVLRNGGIHNVSLDLIFGIPGQTLDTWRDSLGRLLDIAPEHFSAYILSYPEGTLFRRMLDEGRLTETPAETIVEMYAHLTAAARAAGYDHYEISSYSRPGMHSRHNSSYWDSTPYLGLGPAAHSLTLGVRRENPSSISAWNDAINRGIPAYTTEEETPEQIFYDMVITRLRTAAGLPLSSVPDSYMAHVHETAKRQKALGNLKEHASSDGSPVYVIPEEKLIVSDSIMEDFILL